ncbi:DUF5984 family protein [Ideonella azotifigens]|uniref:Uncharacterized protein n=1 Tax=Ideonella azotifigens TaxID=513160 RepID=A0ABP3VUG5_9BURK|nr:DUF5984 family protein [Ideonella azotifigens]MCD2340375.1 DUF5984 family protein [Ideonella azotifigens]
MLFNFELRPLAEIRPWGEPGAQRLHWYGLTDSEFWIEVGGSRLLEYSEDAQRHGTPRFCDYQAARLYEDVIALATYALERIPFDLVPYISGQGRDATLAKFSTWCDKNAERDDDQYWSTIDCASSWIGKRELDTAYLTPSADVLMWSDISMVHIEWDNREKLFDGLGAWSALFGNYSLARSDFVAECISFHERLMSSMAERVGRVAAGALSPEIHVDLEGLHREHQMRMRLSEVQFGELPSPTDWQAVRQALKAIGA